MVSKTIGVTSSYFHDAPDGFQLSEAGLQTIHSKRRDKGKVHDRYIPLFLTFFSNYYVQR
jgi:hypothetical protein